MKRKAPIELGASEFASILNGSDPTAILNALVKFVKLVRRQRRQAFSDRPEESDDDDSSSREEENDAEQASKRFRKDEQWKEDSANYAVPFVGTSLARGPSEPVTKGEWPTGFLKAYLAKSPAAVELTGDYLNPPHSPIHKTLLKRKLGRTALKLQQVRWQAVAELATAGPDIQEQIIQRQMPYLLTL